MHIFPAHKFNPDPVKAGVSPRVITGGESLAGDTDVIATDGGGRWEIVYSDLDLDSPENQRLWEAWTSYMAGGARAFLAPVLSVDTAPRPVAGNGLATPSDIWADDDQFPTEVRFASPYIVAEVVDAAILRATTLTILVTQGARIQGGEKFSIGDRAYKIERVTARNGFEATCTISPPLREAVDAGAAVNFEWPVVQCRLAPGQDLNPDIQLGMYGSISVAFIEDFSDAA